MTQRNRVLLLTGSPQGAKSTSHALGNYLLRGLIQRGFESATLHVYGSLVSEAGRTAMLDAVRRGHLLLVSFPLYVDSLPALLVKAFDLILAQASTHPAGSQKLVAIANSGFPEPHQNHTALGMCRAFAREAGFNWAGGLPVGGGGMIGGRDLTACGGKARRVRQALDLTAESLAAGSDVPLSALSLLRKPPVPIRPYMWMADLGMWNSARKFGMQWKLNARPFEAASDASIR